VITGGAGFIGSHLVRTDDVVLHCAAQPSHDKAEEIPLVDFEVNAVATVSMSLSGWADHPWIGPVFSKRWWPLKNGRGGVQAPLERSAAQRG